MTKDWYIQHGFKMSGQIDQAEIDRAEADVKKAYVDPIVNGATVPTAMRETYENAIGNLAFLLLLQRSTFVTRAGAKIKTGYNSQNAGDWEQLQDAAMTCHVALEALRNAFGTKDAKVTDICKIYFKTNFISL